MNFDLNEISKYYYTPNQIAEEYHFKLNTVYQWIYRGWLEKEVINYRFYIKKTIEVDKWLKEKQNKLNEM